MRIFISAGEPSGDLHAANLVRALRARMPEAEFVGFGGPHMRAAGVRLLYPLVDLAVMWFGRVALNLHKFLTLSSLADRYFCHQRPDAVIVVDCPGFHWWVSWRAKVRKIPSFYYVPPQLWAWAGWRVNKVRKYFDCVLCSLPFEPEWYRQRGVPFAVGVGHPYFDELAERKLDESFLAEERKRGGPLVVILPGSRTQELTRNLPVMLRAAKVVAAQRPDVRFAISCLHDKHRAMAANMVQQAGADHLPIELHAARTPELIRLADVAWAVSGSVGLELMVEALPTVVLYTIGKLDLIIARPFIKARFISLVNLLAGQEVMPEYLTDRDVSAELAQWAMRWLNDPAERARASQVLADLRDRVAVPGASGRAADEIVRVLRQAAAAKPAQEPAVRGPHAKVGREQETGAAAPPHLIKSRPGESRGRAGF